MRRMKRRYVILRSYPRWVPEETDFLYQDSRGYVFKTTLRGAEELRPIALLISGSMKKLKTKEIRGRRFSSHPKGLNVREAQEKMG